MKIGIMGAMHEEISLLQAQMSGVKSESLGMREYVSGLLQGVQVIVVFSRWGKVAASSTATTLIDHFQVDYIIFTGVAGAIDNDLNIGDIVIATELLQHDMDASAIPSIEKFEIPLLGVSRFPVAEHYVECARRSAQGYLDEDVEKDIASAVLDEFQVTAAKVVCGVIASGDQFIADPLLGKKLAVDIPDVECVEMEGAAVAQVAYEHTIPCVVMRTISDKADHSAHVDFPRFVSQVASHFTCGSLLRLLSELKSECK